MLTCIYLYTVFENVSSIAKRKKNASKDKQKEIYALQVIKIIHFVNIFISIILRFFLALAAQTKSFLIDILRINQKYSSIVCRIHSIEDTKILIVSYLRA